MRADFKIGENESPEKELLRSQFSPENLPLPTISPPNVKGFTPPAPLAFTPRTLKTNDEVVVRRSEFLESAKAVEEVEPVIVNQFVRVDEVLENVKVAEEESDWETVEDSESDSENEDSENDSENDFPTIDVNCENWADEFTDRIRIFHSGTVDEQEEKCPNCDMLFTPSHQC